MNPERNDGVNFLPPKQNRIFANFEREFNGRYNVRQQ